MRATRERISFLLPRRRRQWSGLFRHKIPNYKKMEVFGFKDGRYTTALPELSMTLTVTVGDTVETTVMEGEEEYTLYKVPGAAGAFVGRVREQVEAVLAEISEKCFDREVFHTRQSKEIMAYIAARYGDEPEYLWEKFPENAVARRQDTRKWYLALLTVAPAKLGLPGEKILEIVDLRVSPEQREALGPWALPGYHMNKKNWITVVLDDTVPMETLQELIDHSYLLAGGKK